MAQSRSTQIITIPGLAAFKTSFALLQATAVCELWLAYFFSPSLFSLSLFLSLHVSQATSSHHITSCCLFLSLSLLLQAKFISCVSLGYIYISFLLSLILPLELIRELVIHSSSLDSAHHEVLFRHSLTAVEGPEVPGRLIGQQEALSSPLLAGHVLPSVVGLKLA